MGIVGPNGCGKSNVIDAVRWVLGETSARHLRGATMQDVLFNGSGNRKPVNRASVELLFDNSLGKAAGQWSSYAEISVKRVIEREGDSSYYINNIPVRRRDIADIFLGTGLGARAYAIIEQGMISRVIEAKPEELRVFLEEAAGVSKYRERRKETEARLRDTRENLLRVDDIRQELAKQLEHLAAQAEVARRYHELQAELTTSQNLLWFTRKKEAIAARGRHAREIERVGVELEAETAKMREAEKRLEELRADHYKAGDALHACQGALYEANAEVARLEQQISHVRENRSRIEHHIATMTSQRDGQQSQVLSFQQGLNEAREAHTAAGERVAMRETEVRAEQEKLPLAEEAHRASRARREEVQHSLAAAQQRLQVQEAHSGHAARLLEQFTQRQQRLADERTALPVADSALIEELSRKVAEGEARLTHAREAWHAAEAQLTGLEQTARERQAGVEAATRDLASSRARLQALEQLQQKLARGASLESWLAGQGLKDARRLWQDLEIAAGWEDAVEAVLRERLNGIALENIDGNASWLASPPPGKLALIDLAAGGGTDDASGFEALSRKVMCRDTRLSGVVADWLHGVYTVDDSAAGMARRASLPAGAMLVTPKGAIFTRYGVIFHAPSNEDNELHGVVSRQREVESLQEAVGRLDAAVHETRAHMEEARHAVEAERQCIVELRNAAGEAQAMLHAAQVESVRVNEQAQRTTQRGEQIAAEIADVLAQIAAESLSRTNALDRKSTRLNSSHVSESRMPSSA